MPPGAGVAGPTPSHPTSRVSNPRAGVLEGRTSTATVAVEDLERETASDHGTLGPRR
jgi:hypothetical protein